MVSLNESFAPVYLLGLFMMMIVRFVANRGNETQSEGGI